MLFSFAGMLFKSKQAGAAFARPARPKRRRGATAVAPSISRLEAFMTGPSLGALRRNLDNLILIPVRLRGHQNFAGAISLASLQPESLARRHHIGTPIGIGGHGTLLEVGCKLSATEAVSAPAKAVARKKKAALKETPRRLMQ